MEVVKEHIPNNKAMERIPSGTFSIWHLSIWEMYLKNMGSLKTNSQWVEYTHMTYEVSAYFSNLEYLICLLKIVSFFIHQMSIWVDIMLDKHEISSKNQLEIKNSNSYVLKKKIMRSPRFST